MKKASWIALTVAGVAITLLSLISAAHAYNKGDNYRIGGTSVREVAAGREAVASALRGIRGTSAAFATAYGLLFLPIVLAPYRRRRPRAARRLQVAGDRDAGQRGSHRARLPPGRLRDAERPLPRDRRPRGGGPRPPRPRRGGGEAGGGRPHRQRLLHRLPDPRRGRPRRGRARPGAAAGPASHHRERMRGRRGGPGARARLPGRPSRPRGGRARARVREPHLPALGPLRHQRRLHRDLRRRRRRRRARRPRAPPRPSAPPRPGAAGGRGERLLPGHAPPDGLPPPQPGPADHPRPRARPLRAPPRGRGRVLVPLL